jgi:hypothetical protein
VAASLTVNENNIDGISGIGVMTSETETFPNGEAVDVAKK